MPTNNLTVIGPDAGEQACGDVGPGRMMEPALIAEAIANKFESGALAGVSVVITAGPTGKRSTRPLHHESQLRQNGVCLSRSRA